MMVDELIQMNSLAKKLIEEYDKDTATKVLDNLDSWIRCGGDVSTYYLKNIALKLKGEKTPVSVDYDSKVKSNLLSLYSAAASKGEYNVALLESGLNARRDYDTLRYIATYTYCGLDKFNAIPYVEDTRWSGRWIYQLLFCANYVNKHNEFGYNLLSLFTPNHSPETFYEVCYHLKDEEQYRIKLDWLSNSYWGSYTAKQLVYLYMYYPGIDWAFDIIRPWSCKSMVSEVYETRQNTLPDYSSIIEKWKNVSPLLDYIMTDLADRRNISVSYKMYDGLRRRFGCDGDELAHAICEDDFFEKPEIPEFVIIRNNYYHKAIDAIETATDNDSVLRRLAGDRYEEVKKVLPIGWRDMDLEPLWLTVQVALK